ncbi:hypothetical protein RSAG8_10040, partial [Rhizoctonia solani AG-8 WAC10335]
MVIGTLATRAALSEQVRFARAFGRAHRINPQTRLGGSTLCDSRRCQGAERRGT